MIPKQIHYCWFGNRPQSDLIRKCTGSWQNTMPDYPIKRWDETNSPLDSRYAKEALRQKRWARLSNYVRLHALYTEGGVYLDTDVETLKSFTPLLVEHCFLGFQQRIEQRDWVNTAVLAAEPGHPFIKLCMDRLVQTFENTGRFDRSPTVTTAVLKELGLNEYGLQRINDVTVYPVEYFYPYSFLEKYSADKISENTYCVHHWTATWKSRLSFEMPSPLRRFRRTLTAWFRERF